MRPTARLRSLTDARLLPWWEIAALAVSGDHVGRLYAAGVLQLNNETTWFLRISLPSEMSVRRKRRTAFGKVGTHHET